MQAHRNPIHCWLLIATAFAACAPMTAQKADPQPSGNAAGLYKVSGTLVSKTDGHPLAQARVTLREDKNPEKFESVITGDDGKFAFQNVPPGKYSLTGMKRGYIAASYDQHDQFSTAIVTGAGLETEGLQLKLAPDAIIWGRVLDEAGEPVRHAAVTLYYNDHRQGVDEIRRTNAAQTDDLGTFELANITPGTYFLEAQATPWYAVHSPSTPDEKETGAVDRSFDVAYPVTYYADTTDSTSATPIPMRGGERLQVDIHLNPVPALRLLFHVPGDNQHGFVFPRLEQPSFDGTTFVHGTSQSMNTPGVMEITGIPAGQYSVRLQGQGTNAQINGINLTKDGEQVELAAAEPLATLKLAVQISGQASLAKGLVIGLRSKDRNPLAARTLDEKGEAEIADVSAGKYEVVVWGTGRPYSVAHMTAEGAGVSGRTITLGAGATASASITVVAGSVQVSGIVKKDGKGFAGAMVVLVPKNPEGNRDLFRRDQSDLDGTFTLRNVVPGSYTLLAIDNGWDLDWSQPSIIAVYAKRGQAVDVRDTGRTMNLTDPISVVSK